MKNTLWESFKEAWYFYWLVKGLRYLGIDISKHSRTEILQWVIDYQSKIGIRPGNDPPKPVVPVSEVKYPPSYIKVEPATGVGKAAKTDMDWLSELGGEFGLEDQEVLAVYTRCGNDLVKTYEVLQIMEITYRTDEGVLAQFEQLRGQCRSHLKTLTDFKNAER